MSIRNDEFSRFLCCDLIGSRSLMHDYEYMFCFNENELDYEKKTTELANLRKKSKNFPEFN